MIERPKPYIIRSKRWLRQIAEYLRTHRAAEELRVRKLFVSDPDDWRT